MSNLYDVVKDVINCNNLDEANNRLFGVNGITINSQEYYQNIVSNFIKKKEYVIRKSGNNLIFDLNNYNDMWNIIFFGEYIKENDWLYKEYNYLLEEINKINDELKIIKDKHKSASDKDEHLKINEEYKDKELELKDKLNLKDNYKNTIEVFYNIDWVKLENSNDEFEKQEAVKTLKQAINIVHKLRNNIQHGSSDLDGNIKIENEQFRVSIPMSYIDGFNKGRIIANDEDKVIVEKTNTIASPLLESLGYDVEEVDSFFYTVDPEWLSFLLEKVNYDYDKLFEFNSFVFYLKDGMEYLINKGLSLDLINEKFNNYSVENYRCSFEFYKNGIDVKKHWMYSFENFEKIIELHNMHVDVTSVEGSAYTKFDKTLELIEYGIDISGLSNGAFDYYDNTKKLFDYGIELKGLPDNAFKYCDNTIELFKKRIDIHKLDREAFKNVLVTELLISNDINVYKNYEHSNTEKRFFFEYPNETILLHKSGINIYNLPESAFKKPDITIKLHNKGVKLTNNYKLFEDPDSTIELNDSNYDVNNLHLEAITKPEIVKEFDAYGINVYDIASEAYLVPEITKRLFDSGIDLRYLHNGCYDHPEIIIELNKIGLKLDNLLYLGLMEDCSDVLLLLKQCVDEGIDINYLPRCFFDYYLTDYNFIFDNIKMDNIKYIFKVFDNDYENIKKLPIECFTCDISILDNMIKTYNTNIARSIFGLNNPKLIGTLVYCDSVFRNYKKEDYDYDLIDIDPIEIVKSGAVNTYKYRNNIAGMDDNLDSYKKQFIYHDNGDIRMVNGEFNLKANILDKLRNASCHFRFKPVKDDKGNLVEDKIYLYDRDDNGIINFNMIIDIKDLVEITREVELDLIRKEVSFDFNQVEENKYRSR